ncbi:5-formyltetrahydrofolate cyclo-ligase [Stackebrandtia endophytica]|uniref:5-formyltetrahydrofolate cyclo-ligase n=1 Tax=Stackebrandtia endophytica TaxID=1496996 RepID=A0A543AYT0_9ACTN|nr:5-formyltetrahydrofolate cyclo-ligase [Stackebrandtia endophytica]TQL77741.1 5-formyltetrahydrofolate cyclo-ligase [Stackebrandtia endophytica]
MGFSYQHNDSRAQKVALRRAILAARRNRDPAVRARDDVTVVNTLLATGVESAPTRSPLTVAAYFPLPDEPGAGLPDRLVAAGHRVLLPVLLPDADLDWAPYTGGTVAGARGITQPVEPGLGRSAITRADLVVVPALAVGPTGARLGRGGGSYDRALARVDRSTPVVALLYDGEWPHHVPQEPHDRAVTAVITPTGGLTRLEPR